MNIKILFLFREFDDLQSPINSMMSGSLSSFRVFRHLENSIKPTMSGKLFIIYVFSDLQSCIYFTRKIILLFVFLMILQILLTLRI